MHNILQLITVEPTMPSQPDISEDSHQEVNTDHKILSTTCPSSVLGLMTKEKGTGVSHHKFTGISCWMINTLLENTQPGLYEMPTCCDRYSLSSPARMHCNKLLHFKYSLYNSKTDPASISKDGNSILQCFTFTHERALFSDYK